MTGNKSIVLVVNSFFGKEIKINIVPQRTHKGNKIVRIVYVFIGSILMILLEKNLIREGAFIAGNMVLYSLQYFMQISFEGLYRKEKHCFLFERQILLYPS